MDPVTINIHVNVSLSEATLHFLRQVVPARPEFERPVPEDTPAEICDPQPVPAPKPAPVQAPTPAPEPEPEPEREISDAELREKVKEAKDRSGAKAVREIFAEFGIGSSVECPQGRRSELVERLENC